MVAPARNYPPRHRVGSTQLQLYIKILLFYMAVVYFCVLHVCAAHDPAKAPPAKAMQPYVSSSNVS